MSLPIHTVLSDLKQALLSREEVILVAAPGAGKTTQVPLALLDEPWLAGQRIVLLEPRRLAARLAAQRMADLFGDPLGKTVGYRMRLDSRESPATRILVVTEGVLTRMLHSDPSLDGVGLLIFDEFHERSVDADLGLALSLYARSLFRREQPLRILLMSATLASEALSAMLDQAPVIRSEGRSFPVAVHYGERPSQRELEAAVLTSIVRSLETDEGSLLVFLPGQREIRRVARQLSQAVADKNVSLAPLYGDLSLAEQQGAIAPAPPGRRKVVLATTLAESSLTIEGVTVVIDSGYTRVARFDPRTAMTRLHTVSVSRASADQRAGRAGRLAPGIAYRLWSEEQHGRLAPFSAPEILQADLAPLALQLLQWGVGVEELRWLDPPNPAAWQQSMELLASLGACDKAGCLSGHGEAMAALPTHPRLAHMLLRARELGLAASACDIAALVSERDPSTEASADISSRLRLLADSKDRRPLVKKLRQQAAQFRRLLDVREPDNTGGREGLLLALAYPDRIARQRAPGSDQYRLANGRSAVLRESDPLRNKPWLAVAELGSHAGQQQERIFLAAEFDPAWLEDVLADQVAVMDVAQWQDDGLLRLERQWRVGKLLLRCEPAGQAGDDARRQAVIDWLGDKGLSNLPWTPALRQWQARVLCLRRLAPVGDTSWPNVSDDWLQQHLSEWLLPFLPPVTHLRQLQKVDLQAALHSLLPWPLPRELDELAPTHWTVPTGSRIAIDYAHQPPVLAVKLQEMFGQHATPAIAGGKLPLTLHLLSPAGRPLQVTQDLASFWQNAYVEVRKTMKGRYPKHPWPEDPANAEPRRGTKKQGV